MQRFAIPISCFLFVVTVSISLPAEELPLLVEEDFSGDLSRWHLSDPVGGDSTWKIISDAEQAVGNPVLRSQGESKFEPPHRSPWNIALLKDPVVGNFELSVRVQNTNYEAGDHRDLCVFWGYQDPAHFYYVHLGAKPDPHSCQIFIVNAADRNMISEIKSPGTPWDRGWHDVKVVRDCASGAIKVFFDNMNDPVMTATDQQFTWGRVGIGTFDDNGNFDDFELRGIKFEPVPTTARLPGE